MNINKQASSDSKKKRKLSKQCNTFIESNDMFGHIVNLNFNRNNNSHNTALGGMISILIKVFMIIYIGIISKKVVLSEGNELSSEQFVYERLYD